MTKTNNNKLKILILFFIGLGWNHVTMEDNNNHKRTHSQRQDNEDEITQIDTGSRQEIRINHPSSSDPILSTLFTKPVAGFVNKLQEADMAEGTFYTGEFHRISPLFPETNTIGQNTINVQILNPNIVYSNNDQNLMAGKGLGPFVTPKRLKIINERDKNEKTPLTNFQDLRKVFIEYIKQDLNKSGNINCFLYILKSRDYLELVHLLIKKISNPHDEFFGELFHWVNEQSQSLFYEPDQDLSSIKETHKSNLFETLTKDFVFDLPSNQRTRVKSIVIDEANNFFALNFVNKPPITYSINDGLTKIFFDTFFKDLANEMRKMHHFLFTFKSTKQVFNRIPQDKLFQNRTSTLSQKRYNDISAEIDYMDMQMDIEDFEKLKRDFKLDTLEEQQLTLEDNQIKSISQFSLMYLATYLSSRIVENTPKIIDKVTTTFKLSNARKGLNPIEKYSYQVLETTPPHSNLDFVKMAYPIQNSRVFRNLNNHFAIIDHPTKNRLFELENQAEEDTAKLLEYVDTLFVTLVTPSKIQEINVLQQLKKYDLSPRPDKIFDDERYNVYFNKIMESFKYNNFLEDFLKKMEDLKIFTVKKEYPTMAQLVRYIDCDILEENYYAEDEDEDSDKSSFLSKQKQYQPYLYPQWEQTKNSFDGSYMALYWQRNLKNDILTSTKIHLSISEDRPLLNVENTILEMLITRPEFLKKFMTTFYNEHGQTLIAYSQYNTEESDIDSNIKKSKNHSFRLGKKSFWDWYSIAKKIRTKLLKKYPLAFNHNPMDRKQSYDQLKQAHGEFLLHLCPMIIRNLLYNFSETDSYEQCFGIGTTDQCFFGSDALLLEITLRQIKQTIKNVVYLPNESGIFPSDTEMSEDENLNVNIHRSNRTPLQKQEAPEESLFNYFPMDSKVLDHVHRDALGKNCNFTDKAIVEYVENLSNLICYDGEKLFWSRSSSRHDVNSEDDVKYISDHDKGISEFAKDIIVTKAFKNLLKEPIANGLSGSNENQGTITVYSTDTAVNGVFGLEPRPSQTIINEFRLAGYRNFIKKAQLHYSLAKTLRLDMEFIFKAKNSQFKFQNNYSNDFQYLKVVFQGYNQRKKARLLKAQNPTDQAIQTMVIPPKMFNNTNNTFLEINNYVLDMPTQIIHLCMELIKQQKENNK